MGSDLARWDQPLGYRVEGREKRVEGTTES